jgi:hypothetical protein
MGRPLRKDVNGVSVIGSFSTPSAKDPKDAGIRVEFHNGTELITQGIIIKQRGARTFVVSDDDNFDAAVNLNSTPNKFTCVLQSAEPAAGGQMRLRGFVGQEGNASNLKAIRKITKRVATDFDGVKYTWKLVNFEDSTGDVIVLTPVAG